MVNCTNHCSAIQQRSHNAHHIHTTQFPTVPKHGECNGEIGIVQSCLDMKIIKFHKVFIEHHHQTPIPHNHHTEQPHKFTIEFSGKPT